MKNTSINNVQLSGHIGKDITVMQFDNGNKKASLSLASNFSYKSTTGDTVKHTDWFNLVAWGKTADQISETLSKGNEVSIEGRLSTRTYTDKSGSTRYITEIIVSKFTKLVKGQPADAPV